MYHNLLKHETKKNSHSFVLTLVVRGYHVFSKVLKPVLNEKLDCYREFGNDCDLFSQIVQIRWRYCRSFGDGVFITSSFLKLVPKNS